MLKDVYSTQTQTFTIPSYFECSTQSATVSYGEGLAAYVNCLIRQNFTLILYTLLNSVLIYHYSDRFLLQNFNTYKQLPQKTQNTIFSFSVSCYWITEAYICNRLVAFSKICNRFLNACTLFSILWFIHKL